MTKDIQRVGCVVMNLCRTCQRYWLTDWASMKRYINNLISFLQGRLISHRMRTSSQKHKSILSAPSVVGKGRFIFFSIAIVLAVLVQVVVSVDLQPTATEASEEIGSSDNDQSSSNQDVSALGGPVTDYELALSQQLNQEPAAPSEVTILDAATSHDASGTTIDNIPPLDELELYSNSPAVLTKSTVESNDTLIGIFRENGLRANQAVALVNTPGTKAISVLHPKDQLKFVWGDEKLLGVEFRRKHKIQFIATYDGSDFSVVSRADVRKAGSLVKLLNRRLESVDKLSLVDSNAEYRKIKNSKLIWTLVTIKKGDTVSGIFHRIGLDRKLATNIANSEDNDWLAKGLIPGQELHIARFEQGGFALLELPDYKNARVRVVFPIGDEFFAGYRQPRTEKQEHFACATVQSNLYAAAQSISLPFSVVNEFVDLFDSRIDFSRQLRKGDEFCIIYERTYLSGKPILSVDIAAASLEQRNQKLMAFRHVDEDGQGSYFDDRGLSMSGHFLRSPIKYARVTSVFSDSRYHPILKRNRPHHGVDYGAKTGTPIRATATGRVIKRAHFKGYGKMIVLKHGSRYQTVYSHMSRFANGTNVGHYVDQGQVIGYVGSTGLSTGPHLHYEFHADGKPRDPLKYDMPKGQPIADEYRDEFIKQSTQLTERLDRIEAPQIAYRISDPLTETSQTSIQ